MTTRGNKVFYSAHWTLWLPKMLSVLSMTTLGDKEFCTSHRFRGCYGTQCVVYDDASRVVPQAQNSHTACAQPTADEESTPVSPMVYRAVI